MLKSVHMYESNQIIQQISGHFVQKTPYTGYVYDVPPWVLRERKLLAASIIINK